MADVAGNTLQVRVGSLVVPRLRFRDRQEVDGLRIAGGAFQDQLDIGPGSVVLGRRQLQAGPFQSGLHEAGLVVDQSVEHSDCAWNIFL
jgi:hypothetical protein